MDGNEGIPSAEPHSNHGRRLRYVCGRHPGVIEVGKLADFVVFPVDDMTIPAEDIWKTEPEMTLIGGKVAYTKPVQVKK